MATASKLLHPQKQFFVISDRHKSVLSWVGRRSTEGKITNILIEGPQGCGKSEMAQQFAAVHSRPFAIIEVGLKSDAAEWFGKVDVVNGSTVYTPSSFTEAIQTEGCVIHFQELNRPEQDSTLNSVFSILDPNQRSLWHDEAERRLSVAPGVVIFATMNSGYEFIGTIPLDESLRDRFSIKLQLDYPEVEWEAKIINKAAPNLPFSDIQNLASIISRIRNNASNPIPVSVRTSKMIGEMLEAGIPLDQALQSTIAADVESLEQILVQLSVISGTTASISTDYSIW